MTGRGLRGRRLARLMLVAVLAIDALVALLFMAAPSCMCPMYSEPPPVLHWLIPAIGVGVQAIGLAWMIRIYRAGPEDHRSWWRSKRF
jgi:hypothetical protein